MPSDRTDLALLDIRDNILLAQEFIEGVSFEGFQSDRRTFYAVTRCLEIISEAARRLSPTFRERHPELPLRAIMGVVNVNLDDYPYLEREDIMQALRYAAWRAEDVTSFDLEISKLAL